MLDCNFPKGFNNSTLLNSKFMRELEKDPICIDPAHEESYSQTSQLLDFESNSSMQQDSKTANFFPKLLNCDKGDNLPQILDMLAENESDGSIHSIIDYTQNNPNPSNAVKNSNKRVQDMSKTNNLLNKIDQRLKLIKSSKSTSNLVLPNKVTGKSKNLPKQSQDFENTEIAEHPSVDDPKILPNPTKEKYKKYITKQRSASRGVFEYEDMGKKSSAALKDIKNRPKQSICPSNKKISLHRRKSSIKMLSRVKKVEKNTENIDPDNCMEDTLSSRRKSIRKSNRKRKISPKIQKSFKRNVCPRTSNNGIGMRKTLDLRINSCKETDATNLKTPRTINTYKNSDYTSFGPSRLDFTKGSATSSHRKIYSTHEDKRSVKKKCHKSSKKATKSVKRKSSIESDKSPMKLSRRTSSCLFYSKTVKNPKSARGKIDETKKRREKVRIYLRSLYNDEINDVRKDLNALRTYGSTKSKHSDRSNRSKAYSNRSFKSRKSSVSRSNNRSKSPLNLVSSKSCRPSPNYLDDKSKVKSSKEPKIKGILKNKTIKPMKDLKYSPNYNCNRKFTAKQTHCPIARKKSIKNLQKPGSEFMSPGCQTFSSHTPRYHLNKDIKLDLKKQCGFSGSLKKDINQHKVKRFKKTLVGSNMRSLKSSRASSKK
ncbi:unnamed protein product [Moneuplotes crassus]|uniref:Uncharacterized protein n=1 Tax=Euplotes crassus TaxID=5936 RepID=A0AAD1Y0G9_EUPCR|nr:unnamed protein product [Moneuplotes crassus]